MGMLDDAHRKQREFDAAQQRAHDGRHDLLVRQRADIAEFISAMGQLGVQARRYRCYFSKQSMFYDGNEYPRVTVKTSEIVEGWHLGTWDSEELGKIDLPLKPVGRSRQHKTYQVITPQGELRSTAVKGRFTKTVPIELPYVHSAGIRRGQSRLLK